MALLNKTNGWSSQLAVVASPAAREETNLIDITKQSEKVLHYSAHTSYFLKAAHVSFPTVPLFF